MGYVDKKQKDVQSTPRTKELTKDIIQLTKVMLKVAGKKEKEKILEQIADKQTEIERELARTD
jgi:DNA topoisomerase IA